MSKFLKFLVNLFLVAAILVAGAILIPPLAGINTVIVDSETMDTNLPMGSVTYAKSADSASLAPGDEILLDIGSAVNAWKITEAADAEGNFTCVDAMDETAGAEKMPLPGSVLKVAVMVPWIGYAVVAVHSIEGIVILGLLVLFVLILFILSELWKKTPDEEEEEEEEEEARREEIPEEDIVSRAQAEEELIRIEPDTEAAPDEEVPEGGEEEAPKSSDEIFAEISRDLEQAARTEEDEEDEETDSAPEITDEAEAEPEAAEETAEAEETPLEETPEAEEDGAVPEETAEEEAAEAPEPDMEASDAEETTDTEEVPEETGADDGEEPAAEAEEEDPYGGDFHVPDYVPDEEEEARLAAEAAAAPVEEPAEEEELPAEDDDSFLPVERATLDELLEQVKESGEEPKMKKDGSTGITMIDFTDLI